LPTESTSVSMPRQSLLYRAVAALLGVVRTTVFLALLTLRPLLRGTLKLLAGASALALPLALIYAPGHRTAWIMGGLLVFSVAAAWFYDILLLRLATRPIVLFQ
jgi:hypothetical protein